MQSLQPIHQTEHATRPFSATPHLYGKLFTLIMVTMVIPTATAGAQHWNINFAGRNETNEFVTVADGTDPIGMGGGTWNNVMSPTPSFSWDPATPLTIVEADGGTSINLDWGPSGSLLDHDASLDGPALTDLNRGWFGHWDDFDQTLNFSNIPDGTYDVTVYFTWRWNEYSVDYNLATGGGGDLGTQTIYPDQSTANSYDNFIEGNNYVVFEDVSPANGILDLHAFNTIDGGISAIQIAAPRQTLTAIVNTVTGVTRLENQADESVTLDYYLVQSDAGALNTGTWISLDDGEADAPGLGWVEAGGSDSSQLSELNLSDSLTLAPNELVSLGNAFDTTLFGSGIDGDLTLRFGVPGKNSLRLGNVVYVTDTPLTGDLNGDGFVGIADLNIVLGAWNSNVAPGVWLDGDPSGDGFVGIADLNIVLGNWNNSTPPTAAIPEPASLVLVLLGAGAWTRRRHR